MANEEPDVNATFQGAASVFPYVMVLSAFFLTGFMFLTVNLPLLDATLAGDRFSGFRQALESVFRFWKAHIHRDTGVSVFLLYSLLSLVVGFVVQPIALTGTMITARCLSWGRFKGAFYQHDRLPQYPPFADWLQVHKAAKAAWEWESFNYYLFTGLLINVVTGWFALVVTTALDRLQLLLLTVLLLFCVAHALGRSLVLRAMRDFYDRRMETSGNGGASEGAKVSNNAVSNNALHLTSGDGTTDAARRLTRC